MLIRHQRPSSDAISVIFAGSEVACATNWFHASSAQISIFRFIPMITMFFLIAP